MLGICYGMQLMAHTLGGARRARRAARIRPRGRCTDHGQADRRRALFADVPPEIRVWASHGDFVAARAGGFAVVGDERERPRGRDGRTPIARLYALLFHPEVVHTESGLEILRNFAYGVCGCTGDWTMASFVEEATARIRDAGRRRARRLRAERRRRFDGGGAASFTGPSATS